MRTLTATPNFSYTVGDGWSVNQSVDAATVQADVTKLATGLIGNISAHVEDLSRFFKFGITRTLLVDTPGGFPYLHGSADDTAGGAGNPYIHIDEIALVDVGQSGVILEGYNGNYSPDSSITDSATVISAGTLRVSTDANWNSPAPTPATVGGYTAASITLGGFETAPVAVVQQIIPDYARASSAWSDVSNTVTTINASTSVVFTSSSPHYVVGNTISGSNFQVGTRIVSITPGVGFIIDLPATASGSCTAQTALNEVGLLKGGANNFKVGQVLTTVNSQHVGVIAGIPNDYLLILADAGTSYPSGATVHAMLPPGGGETTLLVNAYDSSSGKIVLMPSVASTATQAGDWVYTGSGVKEVGSVTSVDNGTILPTGVAYPTVAFSIAAFANNASTFTVTSVDGNGVNHSNWLKVGMAFSGLAGKVVASLITAVNTTTNTFTVQTASTASQSGTPSVSASAGTIGTVNSSLKGKYLAMSWASGYVPTPGITVSGTSISPNSTLSSPDSVSGWRYIVGYQPDTTTTSTSSVTPGYGSKTFNIASTTGWTVGMRVCIHKTGDVNTYVSGLITSLVTNTSVTVFVDDYAGTGATTAWTFAVSNTFSGTPDTPTWTFGEGITITVTPDAGLSWSPSPYDTAAVYKAQATVTSLTDTGYLVTSGGTTLKCVVNGIDTAGGFSVRPINYAGSPKATLVRNISASSSPTTIYVDSVANITVGQTYLFRRKMNNLNQAHAQHP